MPTIADRERFVRPLLPTTFARRTCESLLFTEGRSCPLGDQDARALHQGWSPAEDVAGCQLATGTKGAAAAGAP
ncbi:hypothetical protein ADK65_02270 [Streptomyces sp. NRRL B-1140]|nr:hypothetical protein ADK65_02270 [Streptomyces sp. NRRL B-1140]